MPKITDSITDDDFMNGLFAIDDESIATIALLSRCTGHRLDELLTMRMRDNSCCDIKIKKSMGSYSETIKVDLAPALQKIIRNWLSLYGERASLYATRKGLKLLNGEMWLTKTGNIVTSAVAYNTLKRAAAKSCTNISMSTIRNAYVKYGAESILALI